MKLTIGQAISAAISFFLLYLIMEEVSLADGETPIARLIDMLSAAIVWLVMIQFMAKTVNTFLYRNLISKLVK